MKRTAFFLAGLVALAATIYAVSQLGAQPGTGTPAAPAQPQRPQTKIALVNMKYILTYYTKQKAFGDEMKATGEKFEADFKAKNKQIEDLAKKANDPATSQADKDAATRQITQLKREQEDASVEARKAVTKRAEAHISAIYREIMDAAQRFAQSQGYDLVLSFSDGVTQDELLNPSAMQQKMMMAPLLPLYATPGMDISRDLVISLNDAFARSNPQPAPNGGQPK